jgi:hypothetical protein
MSVLLILISSGISILIGVLLDRGSPGGTSNYRAVYYGARCLIQRADPYNPDGFLRVYTAESGEFPSAPARRYLFLRSVPVCVNLPTALFLVAPLALLPWSVSHLLWLSLIGLCLTLAGLLVFDIAREFAPRVSLVLICLLLLNSEVLFNVGNTAGVAVGLCVVAVWCFVRRRWEWAGVICLAISLALKPHDSGLVWVYLLLARGALRKRGLQALAVAALFAIPSIWWVSNVAPDWIHELRGNLASTSSRGDISDPGPTSINQKGSADVLIDLQSVVSVFRDDPNIYNPIVYTVCGLFLIAWAWVTLREHASPTRHWYALAAVAPLTLLVSYHRPYDAKLLLLAIPACAMLWAEGGSIRRVAVWITSLAVVLTGDLPLAILSLLSRNLSVAEMSTGWRALSLPMLRPAPCALLIASTFFLWAYGWRPFRAVRESQTEDSADLSRSLSERESKTLLMAGRLSKGN